MISFKSVLYPNFPSLAINTQLLCCCERLARWELENKVTQDTIKGFLKPCHNPCDCPSLDGEWRHFNVYKDCLIIDDWLARAERVSWLSWLSCPTHGRQAEKAESDGRAACSLYRRSTIPENDNQCDRHLHLLLLLNAGDSQWSFTLLGVIIFN